MHNQLIPLLKNFYKYRAILAHSKKKKKCLLIQDPFPFSIPLIFSLPWKKVMSYSLRSHGLYLANSLYRWTSSGICNEWVAISFSMGSSQPRNQIWVSCTEGYHLSHQQSPLFILKFFKLYPVHTSLLHLVLKGSQFHGFTVISPVSITNDLELLNWG